VPRSALTRIIRPRVEETLEMARDMLVKSGFSGEIGKRIVLTGGASQLTGMAGNSAPHARP
jgi:cell division protein FtsA